MKIGAVTPGELRTVCEKGLLLVTITIPEMEVSFISLPINFVVMISQVYQVLLFLLVSYLIFCQGKCLILLLDFQHILWPFLLKMIIPQTYTGAVAMVKVLYLVFLFCRKLNRILCCLMYFIFSRCTH